MRVVTRRELMAMPPGTLFHEWRPCVFGDLCIKGESGGLDFDYMAVPSPDGMHDDMALNLVELDQGTAVPIDLDSQQREGLFDDTMRYVVWERDDAERFAVRLAHCLRSAYGVT